ncbi:ferredoxin--NADP reductase [Mucilaginibacter sp. BJC16-A38]|uniref:ferredoxin--NADP reductase n=1 Tax=Mucilaginibacter phenanthrenivorans TaxID=1234842 RepID=UPI0021588CC1|nr:ferredoxin--NADP reductase [Mucilaginibacter phenanthrenivorans]MCR8559715.1 ferredoxin--NADP reductase [Mucilaginibacter phenanthrenivorans]
MLTFTLKIAEIIRENSDTVTLCLKQPGLKKIKYLPGQYLTLIFRINGRKYIRPYSFSSAPGVDQYLCVTVKRVPGGIVSNHINDFVKIDDVVEIFPPMGEFTFNPEQIGADKHIFLWGAGSGITPLISIAKYILHNKTGNKVILVYGNRNTEAVIFKDQIFALEREFQKDFDTWHFHTQLSLVEGYTNVIQGRISPETVLSVMKNETNLSETIHYICGPAGLKESVRNVLNKFSVPDENVLTEDFEVVKDLTDFEDITTQFIEIVKGGDRTKVEVTKGNSILNAGLDALVDLDYSCQTGSCMLCKAKILRGNVKMIGLKRIPEQLAKDECLLCCGYPLSDNVQLAVF